MKKLLLAGLLALPLAALAAQPAQAWFKFNAGAGANLGWQSGGSKNFMWGLYKSSDTPLTSQYYEGTTPYGGGPLAGVPGFAPFGGFPGGGFEMGPLPDARHEGPAAKPISYQPYYPVLDSLPVSYQYPVGW
jgi:hypothetical protein